MALEMSWVNTVHQSENELFKRAFNSARQIEGMLSEFSIAVMDMLLGFQERNGIGGNILEIGVFRGRSASVFAHHLKQEERLTLIDIADHFDREKLLAINDNVEFVVMQSEKLSTLEHSAKRNALNRSCRVVHIDASHQFDPTQRELALADSFVKDDGVVILDDFANLNYSQNIAAIYKYLYTTKTELTPFLVTNEKAYLCKRDSFARYGNFILRDGVLEMTRRMVKDAVLARTDSHPDYRAFYLRREEPGDTGSLYGESIYAGYYKDA
jgi:predicted O-methyltransferase YrrM